MLYLVFNEGYLASSGPELVRDDLAEEAIRLAGILVELMPDEPEALGLLALMLLTESRRAARVGAHGQLISLGQQDRTRWDPDRIAAGQALVRACLRRNRPGPYQLQAAIAAVHSDANSAEATDWGQIVSLYDQLALIAPSPIVSMNRAIALAERDGPASGLAVLDGLPLDGHHRYHAVRAELLARLGRVGDALVEMDRALELVVNEPERAHLATRRGELADQ
ncbi:MAG: DUF6596 domain-containing protein [Ilumatobacteraceae bacterium]